MSHLMKLKLHSNIIRSLKYPIYSSSFYNVDSCCRCFGSLAVNVEVDENTGKTRRRVSNIVKTKIADVLLDYLHCTRSLHFSDAEHISRNSPHFLKKLAKNVCNEPDVRRCMSRFLNYHPINEFEPFFESIGLEPSEFGPLLPRHLLYLSDDDRLIDNYRVLCEYGIDRVKIGKIYLEAREVFGYDQGVLRAKLQGFEDVGITKDIIARVISGNPNLLISGTSKEFFELVRKLKCLGCENSLVEQWLVETTTYNPRQVTQLLYLLHELGCDDQDILTLVGRCPELLFDHSGRQALLLIGFLLKFGASRTDICSFILRFPQVEVEKFVWNLRRVFDLLYEIQMDAVIMGRIIREHFTWMGTCSLKRANSILNSMNTGKKNVCKIIVANPMELKKWTLRARINRLPETRDVCCRRAKIKFLTSIGYAENSKEIERALKVFHGKGNELRKRFNCLVKAGLSKNDVAWMIKSVPQILNQTTEILQSKISVLVNDLGYPVSSLRPFPGFMSYTMERVRLRGAMYRWLIDQKVVQSTPSLRTLIGNAEVDFVDRYVNRHPRGPQLWNDFKQTIVDNSMELKKWPVRSRIYHLLETRDVRYQRDKTFLTSIGYTEKSKEIVKFSKMFRGKGNELPERFNCLVKASLSEHDVARMFKSAPQILNQSIEVIEAKISVLVNDLGYPVSSLKPFPGFLSHTMERVKLRCAMYRWLIDQKVVRSTLSLRTIVGYTEVDFFDKYVNRHPRGPQVWQDYKQTFSSV